VAIKPGSTNTETTGIYLNMGNALRAIASVTLDQQVGHATNIKIQQAKDNAGTDAKDIKTLIIHASEDTDSVDGDVLVRKPDAFEYTVLDDAKSKNISFKIDGEDLDVNNDFTHITVVVAASGEATNMVSSDYITQPRNPGMTAID